MTEPSHLTFRAEGDAFHGGQYDLRAVESLLTDYRRLADHTLPLVLGQKTLTDRLKGSVSYQVAFETGSWVTILEFVLEHKELVVAMAGVDGGPQLIAEYVAKIINGVLELRRALDDFLKQGAKPQIKLASDNNISVPIQLTNVNTGGGNIIVAPTILIAAEGTRSTLDSMINTVDGDQVERITLTGGSSSATITPEDRRITGTLKEELSNTLDVVGRLNIVAFDSHRGQLMTENGRFPVTWEDSIRHLIREYADVDGIAFVVRPIIDKRRFHDGPVGLHILSCRQPQQPLVK